MIHAGSAPELVLTGSLPVAFLLAALAGMLSFASPCVFPLVPGFLGYLTGATPAVQPRRVLAARVALFIAGFTGVYLVLFATFSAATRILVANQDLLTQILGLLVIVLGVVYAGWLPGHGSWTPRIKPLAGWWGAPILGVVFGLSMSPCSTPTLAAVLALATGSESGAARGVFLAGAYSLGLGAPFMVAALSYARALRAFSALRKWQRAITVSGGIFLILLGILMLSGIWGNWMTTLGTTIVNWRLGV